MKEEEEKEKEGREEEGEKEEEVEVQKKREVERRRGIKGETGGEEAEKGKRERRALGREGGGSTGSKE